MVTVIEADTQWFHVDIVHPNGRPDRERVCGAELVGEVRWRFVNQRKARNELDRSKNYILVMNGNQIDGALTVNAAGITEDSTLHVLDEQALWGG